MHTNIFNYMYNGEDCRYKSAIYSIVINGGIYIGSAKCVNIRWKRHINELNGLKHPNKYLLNAYIKYGSDKISFNILEIINFDDELLEREQHYIDTVNPIFNMCKKAGNCSGLVLSNEAKARISVASKKQIYTDITRAKISAGKMGHTVSDEARILIGVSSKGRKHTDISKLKMSMSRKGKKHTELHREHMCGKGMVAYNKELADSLREQGMSYAKISKIIGVGRSTVSNRMNGRSN